MTTICYLWSNAGVKFKDANWRWRECFEVPDTGSLIIPGVDASQLMPQYLEEPWNSYKKHRKLIELICRINGIRYEEEKEKMDNISLNIKGVKVSLNSLNVDVKFKLEE